MEDTLNRLIQIPAMRDCAQDDVRKFIAQGECCELDSGTCLVNINQIIDKFYILLDGSLRVYLPQGSTDNAKERDIELATLEPGQCVGEFSFIDKKPTSATVITSKPCRCFVIGTSKLEAFLDEHQDFARCFYYNLLAGVIDHAREGNENQQKFLPWDYHDLW